MLYEVCLNGAAPQMERFEAAAAMNNAEYEFCHLASADERRAALDELKRLLSPVTTTDPANESRIIFVKNAKTIWFSKRYSALRQKVANMSLREFSNDNAAAELEKLIKVPCESYLYFDGRVYTIDEYMRAQSFPCAITIGNILIPERW